MTLLLPLLLACTFAVPTTPTHSELNELLDSLRQTHAPDSRIQLWEVQVQKAEGHWQVQGNLSSQKTHAAVQQALETQFPSVDNQLVLLPKDGTGTLVNALVNNSVIHLRRDPSSKTELVTQALLGTPIRVLKTERGKCLIQVPDGYLGWVNSAEVHRIAPKELKTYRDAEKVIYTAQSGLAYSTPDVTSMPMTDLVVGNIVRKVSEQSGFTQIRYPDGRLGWVDSRHLRPADAIFFQATLQENLVQTALKFHGIPYLWGGMSAKNIDCSGLICNVYFMNGIQLPRDSNMQANIGREVTTDFVSDDLEPGDLLFFGRKATPETEERVTHVAMYIGEGEFIHSAGYRERVSINSMDSAQPNFIESYPAIFVRAVRIIGEDPKGFLPIPKNDFYNEIIRSTE
ncbi:dipeptidyl-peptidase VI [Rhodopirellula islandica]|uniref:Dipeptidyl-peptidase VI n=1 Tax=Rhodopirellula islandica TaxID=595434 RepID=A0A0J1BLU9_RHOIS|nr:NlpC/P60 family protein [Rhodopirellula islandica]KLU07433.1 dipeptidyl-peptidase VI [Rhodopirellula islandica]